MRQDFYEDQMKKKNFDVQARLLLLVTKRISASSLEEAVEITESMQESDFVGFRGDYMDGNIRITGVCESGLVVSDSD
jgi:hypothetical protein